MSESSNLKYISGLLSFTSHYSEEFNKQVYILGESHDKLRPCDSVEPTADKFLFRLLNNSKNYLVYVFFEESYNIFGSTTESKFKQLINPEDRLEGYMFDANTKLTKQGCFIGS